MADYHYCDECKCEHDENGRTREDNRALDAMRENPLAAAREQLEHLKAMPNPLDDASLSTAYVCEVATHPTTTVKSLQLTYTRAAIRASKVRNLKTNEPESFAQGDALAALLRTAVDGLCSTHDALEPDGRERILATFTSLLDEVLAAYREHRPKIDAEAEANRKMRQLLISSLEAMIEMAELDAKQQEADPQRLSVLPTPATKTTESAEERARRTREEQAILMQFTKQQNGKVH